MIKEFKDTEMRDSAILYKSVLEQVKMLHEQDPAMAGELAISAMELLLTGGMSTDNPMIPIILANLKIVNEKNREKYEKKVLTQKQTKIKEYQLDEIAELYAQGLTQTEIGVKLGISQQKVSYRINNMIKSEYPELLTKYKNTKNTNTNDNVNDNVNVNEKEKEKDNENDFVASPQRDRLRRSACRTPFGFLKKREEK